LPHPAHPGAAAGSLACCAGERSLLNGEKGIIAMLDKVRLNLQVSSELNNVLEKIADSSGSTKTDVIRQALALMKVAYNAKKNGKHLGLVADADKLDTEIIGLL
jgi:hypothetical protein